jgi:hypothetical protein
VIQRVGDDDDTDRCPEDQKHLEDAVEHLPRCADAPAV